MRVDFLPVRWIAGACLVLLCPFQSFAQTNSELLLKPWPAERLAEAQFDVLLLRDGESGNAPADFNLTMYESSGRLRLFPGQRADPRFGFDLNYLDIDSDDPALPDSLIDHSIAVGTGIADWSGWLAGITFGVGYAAESVYDDANGWYGRATFIVGREFDENTSFGFVLDYDGNRSIYPDVPLPGFQYRKRLDPKLLLGLGFPITSIRWTPDDRLTAELTYTMPDRLDARIDYRIVGDLGLFANYAARTERFAVDGLPSNRYLIFEQRRIEGGVRWDPFANASLLAAAGYAFQQEFNIGWDTRHARNIAEPSDEPYVRFGFEVRY